MTGPIDTIREALNLLHIGHQNARLPEEPPCPYCERRAAGLAALTEVEHQLEAGLPILSIDGRYVLTSKWAKEQARAVAAETALAEWQEREGIQHRVAVAAERRANDLTEALARADATAGDEHARRVTAEAQRDELADELRELTEHAHPHISEVARAALDRHTPTEKCHICGEPRNQPGEDYCSAAHGALDRHTHQPPPPPEPRVQKPPATLQ